MAGRIFLPSLILGFHGCDKTVADRVLAGRQGLRPNAGVNDRNHIQHCVVYPACIEGYFRPLPGDSV